MSLSSLNFDSMEVGIFVFLCRFYFEPWTCICEWLYKIK